jgi:ABC-type phosphate transport system ATPase subunit
VLYLGKDIYDKSVTPEEVRGELGIIFQTPCLANFSVYENLAFAWHYNRKVPNDKRIAFEELL